MVEENGETFINDNYIRYVDTLVKKDGKWLISVRDQYFLMSEKRKV